jgi:hypothetical protein
MLPEGLAARARRAATLPNVLHALLFILSLSIAFGAFDGSLFGWHPFAMSLAYVCFMAEGLLSAWGIRSALGDERVHGIEAHALMQVRRGSAGPGAPASRGGQGHGQKEGRGAGPGLQSTGAMLRAAGKCKQCAPPPPAAATARALPRPHTPRCAPSCSPPSARA